MAFQVIAEPQAQFDQWLRAQQAPARAPRDSLSALGQQLFVRNACAFCHTIRGTDAGGRVAPDLTHLASRTTLAAGTLRNTFGNLEAWILNAPSIKPGTRMPALNQFNGEDARALVAYLVTLE
jgi:cytochrome c oxidase subunit 2